VAAELLRRGWAPDVVLSSDAARTRETWERMARALPPARLVAFTPALYHAGIGAVQAVIEPLGRDVGTVLVLGHNPGFEDAVGWLSGQTVALTTANAALLAHADAPWAEAIADGGTWRLEAVLRPRDL
jgi:phosphohistidine phosphatase